MAINTTPQVLCVCVAEWCRQQAQHEADTLVSASSTSTSTNSDTNSTDTNTSTGHWCTGTGGPLLLLVSTCLLVPTIPLAASTSNTSSSTSNQQELVSVAAVTSLISFLPHCELCFF